MLTTDRANPVFDRIPERFRTATLNDLEEPLRAALTTAIELRGGVVLYGPTGRGKSHAMAALAREVRLRREAPSYVDRWVDWTDMLEDARRAWKMRGDDAHRFDPLVWAARVRDPLFIDDVGAESQRDELGPEKFPWLVNERYKNALQISITTNLPPHDLEARYGTRTMSRLQLMCTFVGMLSGPDRRVVA